MCNALQGCHSIKARNRKLIPAAFHQFAEVFEWVEAYRKLVVFNYLYNPIAI